MPANRRGQFITVFRDAGGELKKDRTEEVFRFVRPKIAGGPPMSGRLFFCTSQKVRAR